MKKLSLILFSLLFLLIQSNLSISAEKIIIGNAKVIDGDSIKIGSKKIRLFGIDAPEKKQKCKKITLGFFIFNFQKENACGLNSTKFLKKKIHNREVKCKYDSMDFYKRFLSICFYGELDINQWMVRNGQAIAYRKYSKKYVLDENYARENKVGIWKGSFTKPEKWRRIMN